MIQPTVGRVVWFYRESLSPEGTQPFAAIVAHVWSDRLINVGGFNSNGEPFAMTFVQLIQDDDAPNGPHCTWMPYQKGQAAKTEALETKLAGTVEKEK